MFTQNGRRGAFSILEVIVSCALLVVLAAVITPSISGYLYRKQISDSVVKLESLAAAINSFHTTVLNWPGHLSDLTENITASDRTGCTSTSYASPARWVLAGPYFPEVIPTTGYKLPIGIANDLLQRVPNSAAVGMLNIVIPNVRFQDAQAMNDLTGGPGDANQPDRSNTTGVLRWSVPDANDRVIVTYGIPVNKFC